MALRNVVSTPMNTFAKINVDLRKSPMNKVGKYVYSSLYTFPPLLLPTLFTTEKS
jgi:hypothetical protein